MIKQPTIIVDIEKIATTNDVLDELQYLGNKLDDVALGSFQLFNTAYCIVTTHIQHALEAGYFKDPKLIDIFAVTFASRYFSAVNDAVAGTLKQSSPWTTMKQYANIQSAPVFLSLLIGANAHINYDLPQALKTVMRGKTDGEELKEIATLNKILMESGKEIINSFDETNPLYDFLKRRLRFTYYRPAMYTILYWRIIAWKNYKRLRHDEKGMSRIEKRSARIAKRLLRVARILGSR